MAPERSFPFRGLWREPALMQAISGGIGVIRAIAVHTGDADA
jgi:hypothetical protein